MNRLQQPTVIIPSSISCWRVDWWLLKVSSASAVLLIPCCIALSKTRVSSGVHGLPVMRCEDVFLCSWSVSSSSGTNRLVFLVRHHSGEYRTFSPFMQCATHPLSSRVFKSYTWSWFSRWHSDWRVRLEGNFVRLPERFSLMRRYKSNSIHLNWIILSLYPRMDVSAANE